MGAKQMILLKKRFLPVANSQSCGMIVVERCPVREIGVVSGQHSM